jgi:hypothetical protein
MKGKTVLLIMVAMLLGMAGCAGNPPAPQNYSWEIRELFVLGFDTPATADCPVIEWFPNMPDEKGGFLLHIPSYQELVKFRMKSREEILELLEKTKASDRIGHGESRRLRVRGRGFI